MNIAIWDVEWYHKQSFIPNVKCMKISSYHKQKGDTTFLISEPQHLSYAYDTMYIIKEKATSPMPPRKILDDNRTVLIGAGLTMFKCKQPGKIIMACRPDYLLYETEEKDKFGNANFITFFAGNELITTRQDYHNTKRFHHFTIVADKYLWKATDEEIIYCLSELKNDKNLMFLEPISLQRILSNNLIREKFLKLHFSKGTPFKWKNDYSSEHVEEILKFLNELRQITKSNLGFIPIKAVVAQNEELDIMRCLTIIDAFKQAKCHCIIINNAKANGIFEWFEIWTRYLPELSFVEFTVHNYCKQHGVLWYNVLNNSMHWHSKQIDYLLRLLAAKRWINYRPHLLRQWGTNELNGHAINYDYIKQNINLLYKEFDDE